MVGRHEVDEAQHDAYVWSVRADKLLEQGLPVEARQAMAEASSRDLAYSVRAELIGQIDGRRAQVSTTVRRMLMPFLTAVGFHLSEGRTWTEGRSLSRIRGATHDGLLIGRDKFGHRLGVMAARWRDPSNVEYYDWRAIGLRSGARLRTRRSSSLKVSVLGGVASSANTCCHGLRNSERAG